jgi:hypothetical protein
MSIRARLVAPIILLSVCPSGRLAAGPSSALPFELVERQNLILLTIEVDGRPAVFVLDTGAAWTVVDATHVGMNVVDLARARFAPGAGAAGEAVWTRASLRVGGRRWTNRPIVAMNLADVSARYGRRIDGLLGQDVLRECGRVVIDFTARMLILE